MKDRAAALVDKEKRLNDYDKMIDESEKTVSRVFIINCLYTIDFLY
jgi:hypothetical protein